MREVFVIPSMLYFCKKASNEKCHCMITFYLMRRLKDYRATLVVSFQILCLQYNFNPLKKKHQYVVLNLFLLANECSIVSTFFYIDIGSKIMQNFYWLYSMCINVRLRYKKKWIQSYFYFFIIYLIWPLVVLKHDGSSHDFINATLTTNLDS